MIPSRFWLEAELRAFSAELKSNAMVLDAGAGDQVYRPLFDNHVYESADFERVEKRYAPSTYVCDLTAIPVENERYDAVVFSQVMEHLPDPRAAVKELHRVLKPGGLLFYSAPLFYEEHEVPFDFYRYTQFGVREIFESSGFLVRELRWLEGYMGTLHYQLRRMAKHIPTSPSEVGGGIWGLLTVALLNAIKPALRLTASLARRCDVRHRYTGKGYPINYLAIAVKYTS